MKTKRTEYWGYISLAKSVDKKVACAFPMSRYAALGGKQTAGVQRGAAGGEIPVGGDHAWRGLIGGTYNGR